MCSLSSLRCWVVPFLPQTQARLCQVSCDSTRDGKQPKNRNTVFLRTARREAISNRGYYCLSHGIKVPAVEVESGSSAMESKLKLSPS